MDRKNGGLASNCAVSTSQSSDLFKKVVAPLQSAYLYGESKEAFKYTSAYLFNHSALHEKYDAFRANRKEAGYSEEELKEDYGFLLFDDINKATELGETGVLTGSNTCTILGDPSTGVYISKYSDCLAPDHWNCGKSGFIVIIRLTKGRIKKVQENYTQNCSAPSVGFDCHESNELSMVSAHTSSFLAYERTQYYLYELLPGDCSETTQSPSHVCPFAIVPFSYEDAYTKATTSSCQEQSNMDGNVLNNVMWRGQFHISSQIYHVQLKSKSGTLIPVKLPPVVKVDRAVSMVTLRQFAPKAVFETQFSGEVSMDGIRCSVYEFVPIEVEDSSLSPLIQELKDKDISLTVCLNEGGFLQLLHSSNFATCTGVESSGTDALQAMFLFPGSSAIQNDAKGEWEESQISSDILHILPALNYAEIEVQKSSIGQSEDLRGKFVQQIKNYAALIHSGLAATPSKDVQSLLQDFDEPLSSLCSSPKWTNQVWQWLRSYLSYPVSFQLPVNSLTELLAGGKQLQKEVLDEDEGHVCLPPLEQAPGTVCSVGPEELWSKATASDVSSSLHKDGANKDSETNGISHGPLSHNPAAELVVSITSAEGTTTVMDKCLSGSNTEPQLSSALMATNTVDKPSNSPITTKLPRGRPKGKRKLFKRPQADQLLTSTSEKPDEGRPPSQCTLLSDSPETEWTILAESPYNGGKLTYKYKKVPQSPQRQEKTIKRRKRRMENVTSTGLDACSPTRKTDRWDLRPIITGCGRTLLPHGSLNSVLQKNEYDSTDREQRFKEIIIKLTEEACQPEKMDQDPIAGQLAVNTTNNENAGDESHNTEVEGSPCPKTSRSQHNSKYPDSPTRTPEFGDHSMVNIAEANTSDSVPSSTADVSSNVNDHKKSKRLLCKLKTLVSRGKGKTLKQGLGDTVLPVDAQPSTEPLLKKCKSGIDREMLRTETNIDCQDSRERNEDVLRTFAQALGLIPRKVPDKIQENTDTLEKQPPLSLGGQFIPTVVGSAQLIQKDPSPVQETVVGSAQLIQKDPSPVQETVVESAQLIQKDPSPVQETVVESAQLIQKDPSPVQEKLQVKKKKNRWWERCPISSTAESPKNNVCAKSKIRKKRFSYTAATNALLAKMALDEVNNQAHIESLLITKRVPRWNVNMQSDTPDYRAILASMLNLPSESPVGLLASKDVIPLVAKEHAYSSSTTLQVPKTSYPEGMPKHFLNLFDQGLPAPCNVHLEGTSDQKASMEHMNKDAILSRRFRRSRIFVEEDGCLKVKRKWKGDYDFDLDSKFTNHPVEKTVCRGLHGSWNFAVKDNGEEAQLIIHMWIGLFYSHSTPRFIHSSHLDLEDCLEMPDDDMLLLPSEHKTHDLEPIQEDGLVLNEESKVLDLSIKKQDVYDVSDIAASCHKTNGEEASKSFIREAGIQAEGPAQCQAKQQVIKLRPSEFDDDSDCTNENIVKSSSERVDASPESAKNLEDSAVNSISKDKTCNSLCKVIPNKSIQPQLVLKNKASIDPEGSSKEISKMGERNENLQNTKVAVEPPIEMDTSCQIMKGVDEEQNYPCTYVVGTDNYDGNESKCEDHRRDTDSHKSPVPFVNLPDNETQSMDVTSITLPHGPNENGNEDKDCQLAIDQGHFTKEENSLKPKSVSDGHGTIKGDVPGVSCQSLPVGQPFKDGEKDASTDKMLPMQYANSSSTSGDHTISEKNVALDKKLPKENDYNESVDQAEMLIFGEQEKSNDSTPLQDGIVDESQAEVLADVSVVSCSPQEQDDELIENQVETAHILGPEAASYHPPKDGDSIQEVEAGPQVLPLQDNPVEVGHEPNEMAMNIDVYRISLDNYEKDPKAENVLSVFEDSDSKHKLGSEDSEADTRCPTPTNGDGPLLFCQATLGQQNDGDGKKDASSDEMLQTQYANENTSMNVSYDDDDDDATSEENLIIDMDKMSPEEHDPNDSMDETNNEIVSDQKTSDNDSKPMQDGIVGESQAKVLPDVSVVNFDQEKDDKLIENEVETAHILAQKAVSHHQAQSPQDGFTLLQDPSEMRLFGKDDSLQEVEASPHVLPLQDNPVEVVYEPKAMAMNTDLDRIALENCKKDPIVENILSVFVDSDSQPKLASKDIEADKICPTSTNGEGPVGYCQAILDGQPHDGDGKMDASSEEMLQTQYANENFMDGGVDSISEEILDIQSEFNERCPTPTRDENLYEYIPSLEQSIPNQVCKSSPGKEHRTNSTLTHQWGKEVYVEPELKLVGDQDPGRELCEENQNPRSGLLKTTDLPSSLIQSPALCRKSIGMDNVNGQTPVKRKMFSEEGCLLPVPCPPKKMSSDQELCKAPIPSRLSDDLHQPRTGCQADEVYKVKEMDNLAISNTSDGNEIKIPVIPTTLTDTLLDNHTSKNNQHENEQDSEPNYMDAVYRFNESGMLTPTRTSIDSMSDEGEYFSSSSFDDPIQDCPIVKKCGQSSSIHSDDHRGVTEEDTYTMEPSTSSFKYTNYTFTKTVSKSLKQLTETCIDSDLTQFSMEQEFLIFSEEMKLLLNGKNPILMHSYPSSDRPQSVLDLSIGVDVAESSMGETLGESILYRHAFSSNGAEANVALSDIEAECARSFHTMMDNVCAGKTQLMDTDKRLRDHASSSRQMRSEMLGSLNHGLNSVVRQSSKTKFRFYILMTSDDAFFEETKTLLEADGHTEVQPSHFFLNEQSSSSSLLLIILRNEDIAKHIVKVPHLLDLKKSTNVLFAGIDQPDDIGNLTHQDLFKKGGFIMLEGTAMEALSFCQMKELLDFLQELSKNGKWKWILHYRDTRRLKENARFSTEEAEKKHLMKSCQETGIVEVLPYHQCDQLSREHPSYLSCLLQLQVQNITARFPVFVTDKADTIEDITFGRHGILTMNINSLLTVFESEKCSL